ncbi:choice-of-anchor V domain-containing protein [Pyrolobus fumarii]|nr:choice-of-anchor V domain-containing protein [Pyrolobus fumarii]
MLKKYALLTALVAVLVVVGLVAVHVGAMSSGAPRLECNQCHQPAGTAEFTVTGLPSKYEPGKVYKITIKITKGPKCPEGAYCGGFAVLVNAGELKPVDDTTQVSETPDGRMLTHTAQGATKREWTFEWKAPEKPVPVTFKIAVLAADGSASVVGDYYGFKEITVEPKVTTTTIVTTTLVTTTKPTTTVVTKGEVVKHDVTLAIAIAALLFVIGAGGYLAVSRK